MSKIGEIYDYLQVAKPSWCVTTASQAISASYPALDGEKSVSFLMISVTCLPDYGVE